MKIPIVNRPGVFALVDDDYDGEWLSCFKWRQQPTGYISTTTYKPGPNRPNKYNLYLHRMAYGESLIKDGMVVTFKNGDKLDCRSCNLVCVTPKQVAQSRKMMATRESKSGYRGVIIPSSKGWAYVFLRRQLLRHEDGKPMKFYDLKEAAETYDIAAFIEYGERAVLNFPERVEYYRSFC